MTEAATDTTSSDGAENAGDERRFWRKVRRTLGRVPFVETAVAAHYCAIDPRTPAAVKAVLVAALAYFVTPVDMIPDFIAALGFTDDAAVLAIAVRSVAAHITDDHRSRARRALFGPQTP